MNPPEGIALRGRMTLGLALIAVGLALALGHAGILDVHGLGRWWPLFLIGIGIVKVRQPIEDGQRAIGVAVLFLGGLFQAVSILSFGQAWPLILVAVGGLLLWQAFDHGPRRASTAAAASFLSEMALIGYLKRSVSVPDFRGGYITVVMGGVEIDLRKASIGGEPVVLDLVAFWGGIDLKVPAAWSVECDVLPVMGGVENKTSSLAGPGAPRLVVRGYAVMGGIVIGH